jgi:hypothetical protein
MVGDEDEGVEEVAHHAVEGRVVREAPVTAARRTPQLLYIYIVSYFCSTNTRICKALVESRPWRIECYVELEKGEKKKENFTSRVLGRRAPKTWCPAPPSRAATQGASCLAPPPRRRGRPPRRRRAARKRTSGTGSCASSAAEWRPGRRQCGKAAAFRRRRRSPRWPWRPSRPDPGDSSS